MFVTLWQKRDLNPQLRAYKARPLTIEIFCRKRLPVRAALSLAPLYRTKCHLYGTGMAVLRPTDWHGIALPQTNHLNIVHMTKFDAVKGISSLSHIPSDAISGPVVGLFQFFRIVCGYFSKVEVCKRQLQKVRNSHGCFVIIQHFFHYFQCIFLRSGSDI